VDHDSAAVKALLSGIFTPPISRELSYRLEQALEVTDALWDLVPMVVAAGEAHDQQLPAETADLSPAAQRQPESRSHERSLSTRLAISLVRRGEKTARVTSGRAYRLYLFCMSFD
jgi:hypothetical protein